MTLRRAAIALATTATLSLCPVVASAETELSEAGYAYVGGTMLSIFYHELGHALIDTMELPLFGPEEDAADTLSAVLTHEIWNEEGARQNATAYALSWLASAAESADQESDYTGVHALDLQRHYRHVCLFYGADPDARADFAADFELPEGRAEGCAEEYAQADRAWGQVLRDQAEAEGEQLVWSGPAEGEIAELLKQEVEDLNERFAVPVSISVSVQTCDAVNAFYQSSSKSITICQEFIDYLGDQAVELEL